MRSRLTLRHARILIAVLPLVAFAAGCTTPVWVTDQQPQTAAKIGVTADIPPGWARYTREKDLVMTRDGFLLETIRITRAAYGTKLEHTSRTISRGLEEHEAAQIILDSFSADQSKHNLAIVDNQPTTIDGHPGFRIEVTYRTAEGLTVRETLYVALVDDSYVVARFTAPDRHYHELHRGAFEQVVQSLKIAPVDARKL